MKLAAANGGAVDGGERRTAQRIAAGVAVSLALHAWMLASLRNPGPPAELPPEPPRPLAVRVQPAPPPPRIEPAPATPPAAAGRPAPAPALRKPRPVIAVPPQAARPAAPDPFVVEQAPEAPPDTPRFDLDAARKTARSLAHLRDPEREGTAVAQFPEPPLETESRAARAIGAAKRRDCKDGVPGGLLAPLLLLADKKDSGCKW
ncbi:hypothetical protein [Massilia sp. SYSU DXS3249]